MEGASDSSGGGVLIVVLALYFIPLIVALIRKVPNVGSVAVVNILLGWTLIGWVVALAMAVRSVPGEAAMAPSPKAVPPRRDVKPKAAAPTIKLQGERFLFGYTVDPPQY